MKNNIGWLYNKSYYEKLKGNESNGKTLKSQNEELKKMEVDSSAIRQLKNERQKLCEGASSPYQQFSLRTYYPGLITGIGMQHQTTLKWKITEEEKTITIPELKLGMAFDHATGLPIIPGSSLKGVLRESFPISNQQGFCDSYDEKRKYIAGIIQNLIDIENKYSNRESELYSKCQEMLWERYKEEKEISKEWTKEKYGEECVKEEKQELEKKFGNNEISDDWFEKYESLESPNAVSDMIHTNEKKIAEFFESNSKRRNFKRGLKPKAVKKLNTELRSLFKGAPNSISDDCLQKASLLAKEIFEGQKEDGTLLPCYERDGFFDAFPMLSNEPIKLFEIDTITHHPSPFIDPNPVSFLKIRPHVSFSFLFKLHDGILNRKQKLLLFCKILCDKGVGAKTNVGYGKFEDDSIKLFNDFYLIEEAE